MGVSAGLYMYDVVVESSTFAISSLMSSCYKCNVNRMISADDTNVLNVRKCLILGSRCTRKRLAAGPGAHSALQVH